MDPEWATAGNAVAGPSTLPPLHVSAGGARPGGAGLLGGAGIAGMGTDAAMESKRDKRRREMADRVERHRRDTIDRKDEIYRDLHNSYGLSLQAILSQPEPSHPEYLLRLHAISLQRDAAVLASRLEHEYARETARQLYHSEVERVEDEYEAAKKAIREKLLEACDERAKKLREEKDNPEIVSLLLEETAGLAGAIGGSNGKHSTRRGRGGVGSTGRDGMNGALSGVGTPLPGAGGSSSSSGNNGLVPNSGIAISGVALPFAETSSTSMGNSASSSGHSGGGAPSAALQANLSSSHISDPFNYSLLPHSPALAHNALHPSMLLLQPGSTALLQSLKTGHHYHHQRTAGGRTKAGYPPNGLLITPGTYTVLGKSIAALNALRAEEIQDDMEGLRKKKRRGAASGK